MAAAFVSRVKIMADMNIVERRRPQDGQFEMHIDGRDLDVRVSTTTTIWGEKLVMRLLDRTRSLFKLSELGMPDESAESVLAHRHRTVRHGDRRRADRQRQDHDAVRDVVRDQPPRHQRHDDRRPGRVHLPPGQPDPDCRPSRPDVRHRVEVDLAAGPRRHPRRRSARRRDGAHRGAVGVDRPPCVLVDPRDRRGVVALSLARHGHRAVPRHVGDYRCGRTTVGAAHVRVVRGRIRTDSSEKAALREARRTREAGVAARRRLPALLGHWLLRPRRCLRSARDHRRAPAMRRRRQAAACRA